VNVVPLRNDHPDDDGGEAAEAARPAAEAAEHRRWPRRVAALAVVAVVAGAVAFGVVQWQRADDLAGEADDRQAVATVSADFAAALLSYDAADLEAARDRVTALSTPSFATEYATAFDNGLRAVIEELGAVATGTVRDVFVADVSGTAARAVVVVDSTVQSDAGTRDLTGSYVQLELERLDGRWLVAAATAVGAEADDLTPGAAGG
jgi:hypothetical protein